MSCNAEIHVGDIGTVYLGRALDRGIDFDFSTATVMELIFLMPNGVVLHKTATIAYGTMELNADTGKVEFVEGGSPATAWALKYTVSAGDGVGSPGEFHDNDGPFQVQGYLEWADGKRWHSNVQTQDTDGQELRIYPNLD